MILMVLDATKRAEQRALLEAELEAVGIRLNQEPPNIYLKQKKAGGMKITFSAPPKYLDEKMLYNILRDYRMLNCEVLVRDENGNQVLSHSMKRLTRDSSNDRPIHRRNHEGPQNLHQVPIRLQQNRQHLPRTSEHAGTRTKYCCHVVRARLGHPRRC